MNDMKEYTAEVMRRAESKQRTRKSTALQVASLCASFVLLIAVLALLPKVLPDGGRLPETDDSLPEAVDGLDHAEIVSASVGVMYSGDGTYETGVDNACVIKDESVLRGLGELIEAVQAESEQSVLTGSEIATGEKLLVITLTRPDGSTASYRLSERRLTNEEAGISYEISAEVFNEFMKLIG